MHFVYILISINSPDRVYIGLTDDLKRRLQEHNKGSSGYSKQFAPWKLETYIAFTEKSKAGAFEKYLKSGSGFAFLKKRFLKKVPEFALAELRNQEKAGPVRDFLAEVNREKLIPMHEVHSRLKK